MAAGGVRVLGAGGGCQVVKGLPVANATFPDAHSHIPQGQDRTSCSYSVHRKVPPCSTFPR